MEYNDENLLKLWAEGFSQSKIAEMLGVRKGVAAGRLRRLRLAKDNGKVLGQYKAIKEETDKRKNNQRSIVVRPKAPIRVFRKRLPKQNFTKIELYDMLRQAVENTR